MAEEHACLVRAHSDSDTSSKLGSFGSLSRTMTYTEDRLADGSGEPGNAVTMATSPPENIADNNESGELLDYNEASVLEQFHEDALRQAGCGPAQARVVLASGLAIAGATLELSAIPFVLPSAEIELCILPHEKNWLVMISLVGGSLGAIGWGALAERLGRRRALMSALAVNTVFAAIAAFMPTYGTFMMARFCSAIGSGGIVPTCYSYTAEVTSRNCRHYMLASLLAWGAFGAFLASMLASAILPVDGERALIENKEHFSAWHRYLLLCTLPILASLISLIWTVESPRFLLDVGREVDAMMLYQNIHSSNQVKICGKVKVGWKVANNSADAEYRLGSLTLPGKRRPPALHHVTHSVKMFWQTFFQLFSSTYRNTTFTLCGTLLCVTAIQFYLSSYVPAEVTKMDTEEFESAKKLYDNSVFSDEHHNTTLQNIQYTNSTFYNCSFNNMLMLHVAFNNCSFENVAFSNIKTSYTTFKGCFFYNCTIYDTDMAVGRELDTECVFNGTTIRGMNGGCSRHADLTSHLAGAIKSQHLIAQATFLGALLAAFSPRDHPKRLPVLCSIILVALTVPLSYHMWWQSRQYLYIVEAVYRGFITVIFFAVCVKVVETYPANMRCTGHGLIQSVAYMGGAVVRGIGEGSPLVTSVVCCLLSLFTAACVVRVR